ncbi:hypothetical protein P43SY_011581 [Pythium insidiosum]|uniref:Uncharacterized protein n=1 Tax=Pythium insidiosum TaxID=114742 RepID=A0AAD5LQ68_PYTIN|nr:hypothetical protein P43SY_011581 [Pythium insidiosum]
MLVARYGLLVLGAAVVATMLWTLSVQLPGGGGHSRRRSVSPLRRVRVGELEDVAVELYPDSVFATDWRDKVSNDELFHLGVLHRTCMRLNESVIPWNYGLGDVGSASLVNSSDADVVRKLRECPDVDVFLPSGLHGHGYCEDARERH